MPRGVHASGCSSWTTGSSRLASCLGCSRMGPPMLLSPVPSRWRHTIAELAVRRGFDRIEHHPDRVAQVKQVCRQC